ncbi:MAG: hypothetical protein IMZ69_11375 [Spirochaetes bacterium]|nr:hypothetical protein [Spirochaetota bacterium]
MPERREDWAKLRPKFRELLYTYQQRPQPAPGPDPLAADWRMQYEDVYGDGNFRERLLILDNMVGMMMQMEVDPIGVLEALRQAKAEAFSAMVGSDVVRLSEDLKKRDGRIRDRLREVATEALAFYAHDGKVMHIPLVAACQEILTILDHERPWSDLDSERMLISFDGESPRPPVATRKSGAHPKPWIDKARLALEAAGLRERPMQTELFVAVGLLPLADRPDLADQAHKS